MKDSKKHIFFKEGDEVVLKQENMESPIMCVKEIKKGVIPKSYRSFNDESKKPLLRGILCFWFTSDGTYQEQVFNTKDLLKLDK